MLTVVRRHSVLLHQVVAHGVRGVLLSPLQMLQLTDREEWASYSEVSAEALRDDVDASKVSTVMEEALAERGEVHPSDMLGCLLSMRGAASWLTQC